MAKKTNKYSVCAWQGGNVIIRAKSKAEAMRLAKEGKGSWEADYDSDLKITTDPDCIEKLD